MLQIDAELNQKFVDFFRAVFRDGALDRKTKELIAIAASLAVGCSGGLDFHVEKARRFGVTDQEIREAIAVAEVIAAGRVRNIVAESSSRPQEVSQSEGGGGMKKALMVPLSDEELLDLCRIILDKDEGGALQFLEKHLKKKLDEALEGGGKVLIEVPGAGIEEARIPLAPV